MSDPERLISSTKTAASAARDLANAAHVPFLGQTASLSLLIVDMINTMNSSKDQNIEIVQQIHEFMSALISVYETTQIDGILPPAILYDIGKFTEALNKVYSCLKAQQGIGKLKQFLKLAEHGIQLRACKAELQEALDNFRAQTGLSTASAIAAIRQNADRNHEALMEWLATHSSSNSDNSSVVSGIQTVYTSSSESFSILPPAPQIFRGRESELQQVIDLLKQDSARIAILGPGGIGKTSLAQAALHHVEVIAKYSERHFVPCNSSLTCADLISQISSHLGLQNARANSREILQYFKCNEATLLVLDNLETTWESPLSRSKLENFLSLLADIPQLALLITMRGAQRPEKIKWTRPFLQPLMPLSDSAALQMFFDIADSNHDKTSVETLLNYTGNLPLAVSLMASIVAYEGCDWTLSHWKQEKTRLLSDGYDQRSSLDISIMLSYSSPRMTRGAQELLGLLSILPDGLSDSELIHSQLPIENIRLCKTTLMQVSLAYVDSTSSTPRLKSLAPIREYIRGAYHPSSALKLPLRLYFHQILRLGTPGLWWIIPENLFQVATIFGNCHNVLLDALSETEDCLDMADIICSVMNLNAFMYHAGLYGSELMHHVHSHLMRRPISSSHRLYLMELRRSGQSMSIKELELYITMGNPYFSNTSHEEQALWNFAIGSFYDLYRDFQKTMQYYEMARLHTMKMDPSNPIAGRILAKLAPSFSEMGQTSRGLSMAQKARELTMLQSDKSAQAVATRAEAACHHMLGNLRLAQTLHEEARELSSLESRHKYEEVQADMHLAKTEYQEARDMSLAVLKYRSSCRPPIRDTLITHINLAFIAIATGSEVKLIRHHLDTAHLQCTTFVNYPPALLYCDVADAHLQLREGNISIAREKFEKCFWSFQNSQDVQGVFMCLEGLGDITHHMYNHEATLRWAVLFLAFGITGQATLSTVSALRYIGDIFAAEGDDETALSLLSASLHGFTLMDIHRWKAKCMISMGEIFERRGDLDKSVELWQEARPLLERSSQSVEIAKVNMMIQSATMNTRCSFGPVAEHSSLLVE
ncbi:hypothetical protein C8R44DRAFT_761634 [Mycena epipterygia]|nr:hypothetical protein C8R44DRAFT_761634 [Mycena epipterygia]